MFCTAAKSWPFWMFNTINCQAFKALTSKNTFLMQSNLNTLHTWIKLASIGNNHLAKYDFEFTFRYVQQQVEIIYHWCQLWMVPTNMGQSRWYLCHFNFIYLVRVAIGQAKISSCFTNPLLQQGINRNIREACIYQNRWISGKFPNGLWPPNPLPRPFFGKKCCDFFRKPVAPALNLQWNF